MSDNADHTLRLGIELGRRRISGVVLAADDTLRGERRIEQSGADYPTLLADVKALVAELERDVGASGLPAGVGTPGRIDRASGSVRVPGLPLLNGRPLATDLERALRRPVRLANDAQCLAVAEACDGAGSGQAGIFAAMLGDGVGGAMVIDGRLFSGHNALAGEWGHMPLPWPTSAEARLHLPCVCGREQCIEAWISGAAMGADYQRRGGHALPAEEIVARAEGGERLAGATLRAWLQRVARSLAMVMHLMDPDVIVIGGDLSCVRWLYSEIPKIWTDYLVVDSVTTGLRSAAHGDSAGTRGAARLWPPAD